jgi:dihydroxyacetone kinase phosphotransfer subunit
MIGIVVVSHSRPLAVAAVALALAMVPGARPAVAVAAGLDETTLGTDAGAIADAIVEVDSPDGVLVFLDLGSAILSAEMALEFVDAGVAGRVRITPAPLVEGLVAALVTAAGGASVQVVEAAALAGLRPKQEHLGFPAPPTAPIGAEAVTVPAEPDTVLHLHLVSPPPLGLHLRPVALIAKAVSPFDADVLIETDAHEPVHADSVIEMQTLEAGPGVAL